MRVAIAWLLGACSYDPQPRNVPAACAWQAERALVFDNAARAETLTRFPVLVAVDATSIDYDIAADDGRDLRFVDVDGTALPHEIELWSSAGTSYVWVEVPAIDAGSSTDSIRMRYGNPDATDAQDPAAVWSNGYVGVWHFADLRDSSPNPNDGTGTSPAAIGPIGSGIALDGIDDDVPVMSDATLSLTDMTLEAWVNVRSAAGAWATVFEHARGTPDWYGLWRSANAPGHYHFRWSDVGPGERMDFATPFQTDHWHYIAGTYDTATMTAAVFQDGVPDGMVASASPPVATDGPLAIGRTTNMIEPFPGALDEVRISNVARSAAWVSAQHASMTNTLIDIRAAAAPEGCD